MSKQEKVLEILADGQWRTIPHIFVSFRETFPAASCEVAQNAVNRAVRNPPKGYEILSRKTAGRCQYRLRKAAARSQHVPTTVLTDFMEGFPELLRQLEDWSSKGPHEIALSSLQGIAVQMKRLFAALKQSVNA